MITINGKQYPLWSKFVEGKDKWVGGVLEDMGDGFVGPAKTEILDITLEANGEDSAVFSVVGKDFTCEFDVGCGGVSGGEGAWLKFSSSFGLSFRIKEKEA
jgi:hypothetical protein